MPPALHGVVKQTEGGRKGGHAKVRTRPGRPATNPKWLGQFAGWSMGASFVKVQSIRISGFQRSSDHAADRTCAGLRTQFPTSRSSRFGHLNLTFRSPAGECSMTEKDYLDPKGYWGDPAGNVRRMSGDSIGAFWSCLFSNFWVAAEGRSVQTRATCLATRISRVPH